MLETTLEVKNPSSASSELKFQALYHTYFRLPEGTLPSDVTIEKQLTGLKYTDKVLNGAQAAEKRDIFVFEGETDRVYNDAPSTIVAKYGKASQQGIKIETKNLGMHSCDMCALSSRAKRRMLQL